MLCPFQNQILVTIKALWLHRLWRIGCLRFCKGSIRFPCIFVVLPLQNTSKPYSPETVELQSLDSICEICFLGALGTVQQKCTYSKSHSACLLMLCAVSHSLYSVSLSLSPHIIVLLGRKTHLTCRSCEEGGGARKHSHMYICMHVYMCVHTYLHIHKYTCV